jgi:Ca2+-binding EF-hand superfamily protein
MIRRATLLVGLFAAICGISAFGSEPAPLEHETVFYLAEGRLIALRLRILVDSENCHVAWRRYVETLFAELDGDGDGELLPVELDAARRFGQGIMSPRVVLPTTDGTAPKSDKATVDVLTDVFRRLKAGPLVWQSADSGPTLLITGLELSNQPSNQDALFAKIDSDGDGKISQTELLAAHAVLAKLDRNDDESIAATELPSHGRGSSPYGPGGGRSNPSSPILTTSTGVFDAGLPIRVLRRYNRGADAGVFRDNHLTAAELGLSETAIEPFDADRDGRLALDELRRFLADPPLTADVIVRVGARNGSEAAVEIVGAGDVRTAFSSDTCVVLAGGTSLLEMRVDPPPQSVEQTVSALFRAIDSDANQYLDRAESDRFPLYRDLFDLIDRDGDDKVFQNELLTFGEKQFAFARVRVVATVEDRGRDLFQSLDANGDGRLDPREFRTAPQLMAPWDANSDGCLEEYELPARTVVTFAHAQPMQPAYVSAFAGAAGATTPFTPTIGREWFQRMDRNADGEISRREFLAPAERFAVLDANGNGAIDLDEAAKLK